MILHELTMRAEAAVRRYETLCDGWRFAFTEALNSQDFGSVGEAQRLVQTGYQMAQRYLETENALVWTDVTEIAQSAADATRKQIASVSADELSDAALEHLSVAQSYVHDELIAQIHRDVALMRQTYQRVALEVSLAARSRRISQRSALIEYRIGNQAGLSFTFHDRATRRWDSKKFIRALYRQALLSVYNEIVLIEAADHGLTRARVRHADSSADVDGMIVAMSANTELPTYSEIRNTVFHPNANAFLELEMSNVSS